MKPQSRALGSMLPRGLVESAAVRYRDREAIFCTATGRRLTFGDINDRANRLGQALLGLGYRKGSAVGFLCSNRAEMADIYFALAKTGIVGIPLNYRLAPTEIVALLSSMGGVALIVESRFRAAAEKVREVLPSVRQFLWIGPDRPPWCIDYESLLEASPASEPVVDIDEADAYYFNLTSGTTGLPKSYVLTHFNAAAFGGFFAALDMRRSDVLLTVFPAFGRVGVGWLSAGFLYGIRNVLMNFDVAETLRVIEAEAVSVTNLVPTMAAMMLASEELTHRSMASLRAVIFAGSMLPAPIREQTMRRICPNLYEYYGMQETGALVVSDPDDRKLRPDSVGRVIAFSEVRIVTVDNRPAAVGEVGEVLGTSPAAATAYFHNEEKSAETFRDGWIYTGDLGRLDDEGYLYICGRKKDMIITGGQNGHAAEVEETLLSYGGVVDCAVIGLPDETWGECVAAVVVANAGASMELGSVQEFCRGRLAGFKIPRLLFVQSMPLPRTPTGKVQKFLLIEHYGAKSASRWRLRWRHATTREAHVDSECRDRSAHGKAVQRA